MRSIKFVLLTIAVLALSFGVVMVAGGSKASEVSPFSDWGGASSTIIAADTYAFDPAHSTIGFSVRHMLINNIPGRFKEYTGTIYFDPADITKSSVEFKASVTSVDTGIAARDNHLRSADFFEVAKYPEMTFKSSKVVRKSKDSGVAHGTFTLKGVSKEIAIPFKLYGPITDTRQKQRIGVEASVTINRQDYGIAYNGKLPDGALAVSNDVNITLLLEAIKQ